MDGGAKPERRPAEAIRVLRLCSVFEPPPSALVGRGVRFDPVGGMQNHTAALTRALDRRGVLQTVLTTRPPTAPYSQRLGERARVIRLGLPFRRFRQLYGPQAAIVAPILAARADLVHVHLGEDLAVVPVGAAAARLRRLPLVLTVHTSLRHTLAVGDLRSAVLKTLGGPIEFWGERLADAVLIITPRLHGLLVEPGDPGALARAIDRLLADGGLRLRLSEEARTRGKEYDWGVLAERILRVYRGVTGGRLAR